MLNKLLDKQIRKTLGDYDGLPEKYKELFRTISQSYDFYEKEHKMMARAIELSSDELIGLYKQLEKDTNETIQKSESNIELKNKELQSKNRELEQFVYIASHDLREPLRTTAGFVDLLQKQYKGKLDDKADKYLSYIAQSSGRMKRLIDDLLDYSRVGGKIELQQVDCNFILQEVLADLGIALREAGAGVNADQLPVINAHQTGIKQLFQNLITNGIKFRKKEVAPQIRIRSEIKDDAWKFSFTDNGIGIDREHREMIFIIFQRLHNRQEYEGSGIGLAYCKKIVESHNGEIWVESIPGEGSTFHFTLPAIQAGIRQNDS